MKQHTFTGLLEGASRHGVQCSMTKTIQTQSGSVMLFAVMVFLIVSIIGTAMMGIARLESRIAINDARDEEARQAADAGIAIGSNILLNCLLAGHTLPSITQVELANGTFVQVRFIEGNEGADEVVQIRAEATAPGTVGAVCINTAVAGVAIAGDNAEIGSTVSYGYLDINN
jgi:Tfp pilus assembly protein PilX